MGRELSSFKTFQNVDIQHIKKIVRFNSLGRAKSDMPVAHEPMGPQLPSETIKIFQPSVTLFFCLGIICLFTIDYMFCKLKKKKKFQNNIVLGESG
jgi:hypothetical protein